MTYPQQPGTFLHTVFGLPGSLRPPVVRDLRSDLMTKLREAAAIQCPIIRREQMDVLRQEHLQELEYRLNTSNSSPRWLVEASVANILIEAILCRDGKEYDLHAFTVMPNHVHLVIQPFGRRDCRVAQILESLKCCTALQCNQVLNREGFFWQDESYSQVIQDEKELEKFVWYVLCNPVMAGLAKTWRAWPWSYVKPGLVLEAVRGSPT